MQGSGGRPVDVLLVEDNPADALLLREMLAEATAGEFAITRVERLADARSHLAERDRPGCIVLDLTLPDAVGLDAVGEMLAAAPETPLVVLSGTDDERLGARAVHEGAQDYLIKGRHDGELIARSLRYAIERKRGEAQRAQLERERHIAETLQRSLLLERLPAVPWVDLAARYLPAGTELAVGGDWYDVLRTPGGGLGLVIGDVAGHGLRAATVMGQIRTALRAYALEGHGPATTLERLNQLVAELSPHDMATALFAIYDGIEGVLRLASAGHPPPLLVGPGEEPRFVGQGGSVPLGAAPRPHYREEELQVAPGSTLLLFTDGLVERRDTPLSAGLERLATAVGDHGLDGDLEAVLDHVVDVVLDGTAPHDDVALLMLRPVPVDANGFEVRLEAEARVLAPLRQQLRRFLDSAGATPEESYEIVLAVGEACANSIEHAYGIEDASFEVRATRPGERLVEIGVRDRGRWREPRGTDRGRGLMIIRGLMDDVRIESGGDGTEVRMRRELGGAAA